MPSKQEEIRKQIVHNFHTNPTWTQKKIAKELKVSPVTVSRVLKRFEETLSVATRPGCGRKPGPVDRNVTKKVLKSIENNQGLSDRERAKKCKTSASNVRKIRLRHGQKSFRVIKVPNRSDKQSLVVKKRSRKLYQHLILKNGSCCIMDDETYVKTDFSQIPGYNYYVARMRGDAPNKFKFVECEKFAPKLLVWQAICSCGMKSNIFVTNKNMTQDLYIKECLQKRLLPMMKNHTDSTWFWPDLASCHCSKKAMEWYRDNEVDILPKDINPPNCPQFRPIERYWAIVKRNLNRTKGRVSNASQLRVKWNCQAAKVSRETVQNLMGGIIKKVRLFLRGNTQN